MHIARFTESIRAMVRNRFVQWYSIAAIDCSSIAVRNERRRSDRAGFSPSLNFARAIPLEASVDFEAHRAHQSVEHIKPYPKVGDLRMETAMATPAIGDSKCSQQRHACRRLRHERAVLRAIGASGAMSQSGNDFDTNTAGSLR